MVEIKANDILNRIVEGGLYLQQNDLVEVEGTNGKTYTIDIKRVPMVNLQTKPNPQYAWKAKKMPKVILIIMSKLHGLVSRTQADMH